MPGWKRPTLWSSSGSALPAASRRSTPGTEEEPDRLDALYESKTEPWEPLPEWWQPPEPDDLHTYDLY
jgi:hypothetical protein